MAAVVWKEENWKSDAESATNIMDGAMTFNESDEEVDDRANFFILIWPRIDFRE